LHGAGRAQGVHRENDHFSFAADPAGLIVLPAFFLLGPIKFAAATAKRI